MPLAAQALVCLSTLLLNSLLMVLEAVAFCVASVLVLIVIGLSITESTLETAGLQLLLAPAVGLAVLLLGFQWLTFLVPPHLAAIAVFAMSVPFAAWTLRRRRLAVLASGRDLAGAAVIALTLFLALLQIDLQRGFFTLGGWPSDNVFIYVQAAQYLVDHPAPSAIRAAAFANPGTDYLLRTGNAFPNSVGPIDAAVAVLTGRPVYAVFDTLNALSLALVVGPVWVFVRRALNASWIVAAAAAALFATNQLLYWVMGNGFQQESLALPIFTAGLVTAVLVARAPTFRGGVTLGILTAALAGVYLPIAGLLIVCSLTCAAVAAVTDGKGVLRNLLKPTAGAATAGIMSGLAALYVLVLRGGLGIWIEDAAVKVPAGGVSIFPFLPYVLGTLPFAHGWEAGRLPFTTLDRLALPLYAIGSALVVVLLVAGVVRAALGGRALEASILVAAIGFAGYEAAIAAYPYGFVKAIGYMMPMTSVFVAFGGVGVEALAHGRWIARARVAGPVAAAVILIASAFASRDMVKLWLETNGLPTLPASYLSFAAFDSSIPQGSTVLVDYPAADYSSLVRAAVITYFLPDRNVRVYAGDLRLGTFPKQDERPSPCAFDFVIASANPGPGFTAVYTDAKEALTVYRREAPGCS